MKGLRYIGIVLLIICIFISLSCQKPKPYTNYGTGSRTTDSAINAKPDKSSSKERGFIRFVVMSDSRGSDNGVNSRIVNTIMQKIKQLPVQPEFIVLPGDLIGGAMGYNSVKNQIKHFKNIVTKYYPAGRFFPGVGNHEIAYNVNGEKALGEVFTEFKASFMTGYNRSVYYFDKAGSRFFMLNSDHPGNAGIVTQTQLNWVKNNINIVSKHNFFFFHEPAYPTGPHVGSSLDRNALSRDRLWQVIDQSKGPIVFCGHEHFYTRRHINNDFNETVKNISFIFTKKIYQVTVGSFGAPLYRGFTSKKDVDVPPISQYHFAVVDIKNNSVDTVVYNTDGQVIDSFSI